MENLNLHSTAKFALIHEPGNLISQKFRGFCEPRNFLPAKIFDNSVEHIWWLLLKDPNIYDPGMSDSCMNYLIMLKLGRNIYATGKPNFLEPAT